jgi:hypothetical protein
MRAKPLSSIAALAGLLVVVSGCMMGRAYDQALSEALVANKNEIMISGRVDQVGVEGQTFLFDGPLAHEQAAYAVRYMGLDAAGNPIVRVLSPARGRTDVPVELAETDRLDLSGYGVPPITVVVVAASDPALTYRLEAEGPFRHSLR